MDKLGIEHLVELPDLLIFWIEDREITIATIGLYAIYLKDFIASIAIDLGVIAQKPYKLFEVF